MSKSVKLSIVGGCLTSNIRLTTLFIGIQESCRSRHLRWYHNCFCVIQLFCNKQLPKPSFETVSQLDSVLLPSGRLSSCRSHYLKWYYN